MIYSCFELSQVISKISSIYPRFKFIFQARFAVTVS